MDVSNVRKKVTQVVGIIQQLSGLVGAAASLDPTHAGLAWAGICVVLPLILADTEERGKAVDGLSDAASVTARYDVSEGDYLQGRLGHDEKFEDALVNLYESLLTFYAKAGCYFAHRTLTVVLRNIVKRDDWTAAVANIRKADEECKDFIAKLTGSSLLEGQDRIEKKLKLLIESNEDERTREILHWTSSIDVEDQHLKIKEKLGHKYSKSGQWFRDSDEFEHWSGSDSQNFWLRGAVGTGKSSLVSIVIDHIKPQSPSLAWFYCSAGVMDWADNSLLVISRTLVSQLALSPDRKTIAEKLKFLYAAGSKLSSDECWKLLHSLIESRDRTTIVIDGLDECPKPADLLFKLRSLSEALPKLKLFVSSQPVVSVDERFPGIETTTITSSKNADDIAAFVRGEVDHFKELRSDLLSADLAENIVSTLSTHAEGMFKWAQLCLQLVLDPENDDTADEIKALWITVQPQPNRSLLEDLILIHGKLYVKHLPTSGPRRCIAEEKADRLLKWVYCSVRPLKSSEILAIALGNFAGNFPATPHHNFVPKACASFIFETEERHEIEIAHSSVREYLALKFCDKLEAYKEASDPDRGRILEDAHHESVLRCNIQVSLDCLTCLMSAEELLDASQSSDSSESSDTSEASRLYKYAPHNWFDHVKEASPAGSIPNVVLEQLLSFFSKNRQEPLHNWLRLVNPERQHRTVFREEKPQNINPEPLYYAILIELGSLVDAIILHGTTDVKSKGGVCGSCLQLAAFLGNARLVEDLLSRGAKVGAAEGVFGSILQAAAAGGHHGIVATVLSKVPADPASSAGLLGNALQAALARRADQAYDRLEPSEKQRTLRGPAAKQPRLTDLQTLRAHAIAFSQFTPGPDYVHGILDPKHKALEADVLSWLEMTARTCQMRNLNDAGFVYETLPSVMMAANLIATANHPSRGFEEKLLAYTIISKVIEQHRALEHNDGFLALMSELKAELVDLYHLILHSVSHIFLPHDFEARSWRGSFRAISGRTWEGYRSSFFITEEVSYFLKRIELLHELIILHLDLKKSSRGGTEK